MDHPTILIIDDDLSSRDISATILRHYGYEILEAENGEIGVQLALERQPHVILMDVQIPGLNGWAATERLKRDPRTADIRVIVFTAHARDVDRARSTEAGADSYLQKPCEPRQILAEVQKWSALAPVAAPVGSAGSA